MRILIACLFLPLSAAAQTAQPPVDAAALIDQARTELNDLDALIDDAAVRSVQKELHKKAERIDAILKQLDSTRYAPGGLGMQINSPDASVGVAVGPMGMQITINETVDDRPPPSFDDTGAACSPDRFRSIIGSVEGESFSDGKLQVLRSAAADYWFTAAQAAQIMGAYDFGTDQVDAGVILFPRVVDQQNWYLVYEVFDFDSDKDKLRKRVGK